MAKIVGITGPSGSGKSLLSEQIKKAGIPSIDADGVYHSMLIPPSPVLDALSLAFGSEILSEDGSLDRAFLAKTVFSDKEKLMLLNKTVLPLVIDEIMGIIEKLSEDNEVVVVDAPTLIESGFNKSCDLVVSVIASKEIRAKRISLRDNLSADAAMARINAQKPDDFYIKHSHRVLYNNGSEEDFLGFAQLLIDEIKAL